MDEVGGEWAPKGWLSHSTMSAMDPPKLRWGSVPISLIHKAGCCPLHTHPALPNLATPMAGKVIVYQ